MMKHTMPEAEIQRLRDLPIEGVAQRLMLKVDRHRCLCPFHEDHHPSLCFNVRRNTFHCYACGAHGNTIGLTMAVLGDNSFLRACRWLADEYGVILSLREHSAPPSEAKPFDASRYAPFFEQPRLSADASRFLLQERSLHPAVVRFCRLNSYGDWLQIPYYSQDGKLIGIQRRYLPADGRRPRFLFYSGSKCHLYNLPVLKMLRPGEDLYVAEGPSDCWAMLSAGHKAIAVPSATMLRRQELRQELLAAGVGENGNTLHLCPDRDRAGERLCLELQSALSEAGFSFVRHDLPETCKDFADYWKSVRSGGNQ